MLLLSILEHVVHIGLIVLTVVWQEGWFIRKQEDMEPVIKDSSSSSTAEGPSSSSLPSAAGAFAPPSARKLVQCLLYPNFGRLVVVFVMIWDQQIVVANIISVLVLTSQWQGLRAVLGEGGGREGMISGSNSGSNNKAVVIPPIPRRTVGEWARRLGVPFLTGLGCKACLRLVAHTYDPTCTELWLI